MNSPLQKKRAESPKKILQRSQKKNQTTREILDCTIRAVEGTERTFRLSFSSEEPYQRWYGPEILDHSDGAVDLTRLNSIGILLFNHNRDAVIGKVDKAWLENGRGEAEVTFDSDEDAEKIYQTVKAGTLKGVAVGYMVDAGEEVMPGKQSADGKFTGPCSIARKWAPFEISIVSVPADPTVGVGRSGADNDRDRAIYETYARQLQYNKNKQKTIRRLQK
ncbi:MAG: HK97 family phage prohead protease [Clostridiales bacterium]|nr:HK97 family phage prohead protease [Clostridiales bacterium]